MLEEITVTARRIAEPLQHTPVAVSAFIADAIEARGMIRLDAVGHHVPNVTFFPSGILGDGSGQAYIRGVGQNDYYFHTDPGVAIYLDGVYLGRSVGSLLELSDVQRIEVLRGPQGSLYGKNAIGGAINVTTRDPAAGFAGSAGLAAGSPERLDARLDFSGPLIPGQMRARLSMSSRRLGGFGRRPLADDELGSEHMSAALGVLVWTPADGLVIRAAVDATQIDGDASQHHVEEVSVSAPLVAVHNALASPPLDLIHGVPLATYDERYRTDDGYVDLGIGNNFSDRRIRGASVDLGWRAAAFDVRWITGYRSSRVDAGFDPDGSPEIIVDETDEQRQWQLSEELRFTGTAVDDRLDWLAGVFLFREQTDSLVDLVVAEGLYNALEGLTGALIPLADGIVCPPPAGLALPCAGGPGNPLNASFDLAQQLRGAQQTDSVAGYAHWSIDLTPQLRGFYGLRYTHESKDYTVSSRHSRSGEFALAPHSSSGAWNDLSHRIGFDYRWADAAMLYGLAATGFKSGGFNGRARTPRELQRFAPEQLLSYEFGLKSEWPDLGVRLNGAVFYYEYQDLQLTVQRFEEGRQVVLIENAAAATIQGLELELQAQPRPGLRVDLSLGYLDAGYTEIEPGATVSVDSRLAGAPRWTAALGLEQVMPAGDRASLRLRADLHARAKTYFDAVNTEAVAQPGYGLLNFHATWDSVPGPWSITAAVTNVADKRYRVSGVGVLDTLGFAIARYGRPREWSLGVRYRF